MYAPFPYTWVLGWGGLSFKETHSAHGSELASPTASTFWMEQGTLSQ
jgi:hypothetical protein